jgi:hypothetical protein
MSFSEGFARLPPQISIGHVCTRTRLEKLPRFNRATYELNAPYSPADLLFVSYVHFRVSEIPVEIVRPH